VPSADLLKEADRVMTICNACRYCEGYCAVFPAMERRREFTGEDLIYMANLCFDCRGCYYACPYTPPHEYAINIPEVFSEIRIQTYEEYSFPTALAKLIRGSRVLLSLAVVAITGIILAIALSTGGAAALLGTTDSNFYAVIPYMGMVVPASIIVGYSALVLLVGGYRFWKDTGGTLGQMFNWSAFSRATSDAFSLAYLGGGGDGCFYPDENASMARRNFHHLVFWGFLLDFASTTTAAFYDHFLDWHAPYPFISVPVVLGTIGGVMLVVGTFGLLALKWRADRAPSNETMFKLDQVFISLLLATAATGLALLLLRNTATMGVLLVVHLGFVFALFLTMPYGKFAHVVYRYAALIKNQVEIAADVAGPPRAGH